MDEEFLTNRELASLLILGGFVAFAVAQSERRDVFRAIAGVWSAAWTPKIVVALAAYCSWLLISVLAADQIGLWDSGLWKPFVLWLLFSGLVLLFSLNEAIRKDDFFRSALIKTIGVAAMVEFVSGLKPFPLWFELTAQVLAVLFAGVAAIASREPSLAPARRFALGYLVTFASASLVWATVEVFRDWDALDKAALIREFVMPIWLAPVALLFVYAFAVVASYEEAFTRMQFWAEGRPVRSQQLAMIARGNAWLGTVKLFTSGVAAGRLAGAAGFRGAWHEIGSLKQAAKRRS